MLTKHFYLLAAAAVILAATGLSCSGGSSAPDPPAGTVGFNGQLLQDPTARVVSAAETALQGAVVSALDAGDGSVAASQAVDANGRFRFPALAAGDYLLRIDFAGNADFDGDGQLDRIDFLLPAAHGGGSSSLTVVLTARDGDADGQADGVEVNSSLQADAGAAIQRLMLLDLRSHRVRIDANGNGRLDDDSAALDADGDGVADLAGGLDTMRSGTFSGRLSAIDAASLTLSGTTVNLTGATRFHTATGEDAARAQFSAGSEVLVRGIWTGSAWFAVEVRLAGTAGGGGSTQTTSFSGMVTAVASGSITLNGSRLAVTDSTSVQFAGGAAASLADIHAGDRALVTASFDGSAWIASRIELASDGGGSGGGAGDSTATFSGSIAAISSTGLQLGGNTFTLTSATRLRLEGNAATTDLGLFDVSDEVQVAAQLNGGTWTALEIRLTGNHVSDDSGTATTEVTGTVQLLAPGLLQVNGQSFTLNANTQWVLDGGGLADLSLFGFGDEVTVLAQQQGTANLALRVTLLEDGGLNL